MVFLIIVVDNNWVFPVAIPRDLTYYSHLPLLINSIKNKIMSQEIYERVRNNPKFKQLVEKRSRFAWTLAAIMLAIYYCFILTIAFVPEILGTPLAEGSVTSIGIPVGVVIIISAFILTGIYVYRANSEFDDLNNEIIAEAEA